MIGRTVSYFILFRSISWFVEFLETMALAPQHFFHILLLALLLISSSHAQSNYQMVMNSFLEGYSPSDSRTSFDSLAMAKVGCDRERDCGGITREPVKSFFFLSFFLKVTLFYLFTFLHLVLSSFFLPPPPPPLSYVLY
jgi:hypothetical protein